MKGNKTGVVILILLFSIVLMIGVIGGIINLMR